MGNPATTGPATTSGQVAAGHEASHTEGHTCGQHPQPTQWRGLATRYDKHAITYRAAIVLNAYIAWARRLSDTP